MFAYYLVLYAHQPPRFRLKESADEDKLDCLALTAGAELEGAVEVGLRASVLYPHRTVRRHRTTAAAATVSGLLAAILHALAQFGVNAQVVTHLAPDNLKRFALDQGIIVALSSPPVQL